MKKLKYLILLLPIVFFFSIYFSLPSEIRLTKGSSYWIKLPPAAAIKKDSMPVSDSGKTLIDFTSDDTIKINTDSCGDFSFDVKMMNIIPVKRVNVSVMSKYYVTPCGSPVGIKIFSDGLLVINTSEFISDSGASVAPAQNAGIQKGDRIIKADGFKLNMSEDLANVVSSSKGEITLDVIRGNEAFSCKVFPECDKESGTKKLGMWLRDSTAGIGTITFYDAVNHTFATLGHGITDIDTGDIITPKAGTLNSCAIASVTKGNNGTPGELTGIFTGEVLGEIKLNSDFGVYGKLYSDKPLSSSDECEVSTRFEVKTGPAEILSDIDGNGVKRYSIEIESVSKSEAVTNKDLVIHITDPMLIEKTGGIVQGMSGSPIIQNNKLVGAVTHVFVNDSTRGYGIFAESMLNITLSLS